MDLAEARRRMEVPDGRRVAETLTALTRQVDSVRQAVSANAAARSAHDRIVGRRAANLLDDLQRAFRGWYRFYAGYDPAFTWWAEEPFEQADAAVTAYLEYLQKR
jgi:hypothetical protein